MTLVLGPGHMVPEPGIGADLPRAGLPDPVVQLRPGRLGRRRPDQFHPARVLRLPGQRGPGPVQFPADLERRRPKAEPPVDPALARAQRGQHLPPVPAVVEHSPHHAPQQSLAAVRPQDAHRRHPAHRDRAPARDGQLERQHGRGTRQLPGHERRLGAIPLGQVGSVAPEFCVARDAAEDRPDSRARPPRGRLRLPHGQAGHRGNDAEEGVDLVIGYGADLGVHDAGLPQPCSDDRTGRRGARPAPHPACCRRRRHTPHRPRPRERPRLHR